MARHIALLIVFGPEVRAFLHSGFASALARRHRVTIVTRRPASAAFRDYPEFALRSMPPVSEPRGMLRLRYWSRTVHEEWLRAQGRARWRHWLRSSPDGKFRAVARHLAVFPGAAERLARLERSVAARWGGHRAWGALFAESKVDCIIASSYASELTLPALQTARNAGLRLAIIANSWKDVYANPYVPVIPDRLAVWDEVAVRDLARANPHLPPDVLTVCGLLHLEGFLKPISPMPREEFCQRFGLDPQRPFICYTAAAPAAVRNEERVVEALLQAVAEGRVRGRPQVLLRINPMESGARFEPLAARYPDLRIQRPVWEWDPAADWNCALREDAQLWFATVYHAAANVSIASTVTLEFAALGRPVFNVCFDLPHVQPPESSNRRFWEADFYSGIRHSGLAQPAFCPSELFSLVSTAIEKPAAGRAGAVSSVPDPVGAAVGLIESLLES